MNWLVIAVLAIEIIAFGALVVITAGSIGAMQNETIRLRIGNDRFENWLEMIGAPKEPHMQRTDLKEICNLGKI